MDLEQLKKELPTTPAFVLDEKTILKHIKLFQGIKEKSSSQLLYSIKALPLTWLLELCAQNLDGFSVSSLFEARLASEFASDSNTIHITTPGLRDDEYAEIAALCSHISFNSISQYQRLYSDQDSISPALRVNPKLSYVDDIRFDPCRPSSKLGAPIETFAEIAGKLQGLHFHTVFSKTDYRALEKTVSLFEQKLVDQLKALQWINLGGGYLYQHIADQQPLIDLIKRLQNDYQLQVFLEPGKALVGDAGFIVSTVIDSYFSDGKHVAVLDTSVSHNPEVFEYQRQPNLLEADSEGQYLSLLVGSSCLAGDIFGEYCFNSRPEIGQRLVFSNVGAYSLIKANRFNGYNLPDVYLLDQQNQLNLLKHNSYQEYRKQW